jgi:hypothetical protein
MAQEGFETQREAKIMTTQNERGPPPGMAPSNPKEVLFPLPGYYKLPEAAKCSSVINSGQSISFQLQLPNATFVKVQLSIEAAESLLRLLGVLTIDDVGDPQGSA